jgi:hypothetical protein
MRAWLIIVLAILLGGSAGVAMTWYEFHGVHNYFEPASRTAAPSVPTRKGIQGPQAVVVDGPKFNFGRLNLNVAGTHKFVVRNEGDEPLELTYLRESCGKCIEVVSKALTIPPGESGEAVIKYTIGKEGPAFLESAFL